MGFTRSLDLLFVIDDSASMADERESLRRNFPAFMNVLKSQPGGLPDLHIGVVSTSLGSGSASGVAGCAPGGDRGEFLRGRGACSAVPRDPFIDVIFDCGYKPNYDGDLTDVFSCIADLGTNGCGYEQPLAAARRALGGDPVGAPYTNAGFLRDDALLGVIIITDEDDCSIPSDSDVFASSAPSIAEDSPAASYRCRELAAAGKLTLVSDFVSFLKGATGRSGRVIVSVVAGPALPDEVVTNDLGQPEVVPSCTSTSGRAAPAPRLKEVADAFGRNGSFTSLCAENLGPALDRFAQSVSHSIRVMCLEGALVDRDPAREGVQPDCSVVEHRWTPDGEVATPMPSCDVGAQPCWRLIPNRRDCTESGFELKVDRGPCRWPRDTVVTVRCAVCPTPGDPRCPSP